MGSCAVIEVPATAITGKANRRNPVVSSVEESDGVIVPEKLANKGGGNPCGVDGGKDADQEEVSERSRVSDTEPNRTQSLTSALT